MFNPKFFSSLLITSILIRIYIKWNDPDLVTIRTKIENLLIFLVIFKLILKKKNCRVFWHLKIYDKQHFAIIAHFKLNLVKLVNRNI